MEEAAKTKERIIQGHAGRCTDGDVTRSRAGDCYIIPIGPAVGGWSIGTPGGASHVDPFV